MISPETLIKTFCLCLIQLVAVAVVSSQEPSIGSNLDSADTSELQGLVEQLNQKASELSKSLNDASKETDSNPKQFSHQKQLDQIRANIQLLKEIRSKNLKKHGSDNKQNIPSDETNNGSATKSISHESMIRTIEFPEPAAENEMPVEPTEFQSELPPIAATRMVPDVVDAFELGNSLFLIDNLEQALIAYEEARKRELTAFDQTWLEFMIASCHRGLGNIKDAEIGYRNLTNDKKEIRLNEAAKSWLDHLQRKAEMTTAAKKHSMKAEELIRKAQEYEKNAEIGNEN